LDRNIAALAAETYTRAYVFIEKGNLNRPWWPILDGSGVDPRWIWGRSWMDLRSILDGVGVDLMWIWARS